VHLVVDLAGGSQVVPHETIRHYKPIYSVNETHWWLHRA
jgi:hypothetical protein